MGKLLNPLVLNLGDNLKLFGSLKKILMHGSHLAFIGLEWDLDIRVLKDSPDNSNMVPS